MIMASVLQALENKFWSRRDFMSEYKCPSCKEPLIENLEEVATVTVIRSTQVVGIEWESEDGEVLFDYIYPSDETDLDIDTPIEYRCGYCGYYLNKATVVEVLHGK
jgi:DNA-directed RNA polymerase subunit RPC12/RpoP